MALFKKRVLYPIGKVNTEEVGLQTMNWDNLGGNTLNPYNPDDVGIATYKKMMKDAEIRSAFNLIKFSTLSRDWKIIFPEDVPKGKEIVKYLRYVFEHMDGRLDGGLAGLLFALPYGFAVSEIVLKMIKEGPFKGKVGLKKLKDLDPETIVFKTDKYGNLEKVLQKPATSSSVMYSQVAFDVEEIELPIDRLIVYTNEKEFGNYYGTSRLRSIYKNWFIKDVITKFWNISLERFGMPMLIGKVPSSKDLTEMRNILENAQARSSLATVDGWEVSALETGIGRSAGGDYQSCLNYHNAQILRGLLIPNSLVGDKAGGSFAKAKVGFELFQLMLKSLEVDLCGIVEKYIIKPLIDINYGELEKYPQFVFDPLTKSEFLDLAKVFSLLVRNGVVGADETWIRDMLRVPKRSETTITRDTGELGTGEEKTPIAPASTQIKITKTEGGATVIKSPQNKRTVTKPTQQVKVPQTSRSSGMK